MAVELKYPMELHTGDLITFHDPIEGRRWNETLIDEPSRSFGSVLIVTDQRLTYADPGLKVQVQL